MDQNQVQNQRIGQLSEGIGNEIGSAIGLNYRSFNQTQLAISEEIKAQLDRLDREQDNSQIEYNHEENRNLTNVEQRAPSNRSQVNNNERREESTEDFDFNRIFVDPSPEYRTR